MEYENPNQQQNEPEQPEKTFTQAELDAIVSRRLAKAQKGMPDEAELSEFRTWKANQQTDQQRMSTLTQERDSARTELAEAQAKVQKFEREKILIAKGVPAEDVDYYAFKAGQLVSESKTFEQAVEEVLKSRPAQVKVDFGAPLGGDAAPKNPNEAMNALIRGARK